MNKYIYDEKNGLWYEKKDDYYLPCLSPPRKRAKTNRYLGATTFTIH